MARYVDANALYEEIHRIESEMDFYTGAECLVTLMKILTADVVEVVYCRDCKYNENNVCIHPDNITHSYDCEENIYDYYINVYSSHFCSYGERRTDNDVQGLYSR